MDGLPQVTSVHIFNYPLITNPINLLALHRVHEKNEVKSSDQWSIID